MERRVRLQRRGTDRKSLPSITGRPTKTWEEVGHFDVFAQNVAHALIDLDRDDGLRPVPLFTRRLDRGFGKDWSRILDTKT